MLKTMNINGKAVKLYPAFRTESHAHDIEYRRNKALNELDEHWNEKTAQLVDELTEILEFISFPMTFLPYNLYKTARETIEWAAMARARA